MRAFFDTSAVVPLLLEEPLTADARGAWDECSEAWAWSWLRVEAEAALSRRKADAVAWRAWRSLSEGIQFVSLNADQLPTLCAFNRGIGLRAADAGHLFVCDRLMKHVPDLKLLTFDREMLEAATRLGLDSADVVTG
ncbi:MAG: type II toxin-antitoxin system VapC family toxin [Verrucomicrobia bacterium]|nr:type II toxin-antitoxin system VapC family toxin [Verrucomicrobiota bacterium]